MLESKGMVRSGIVALGLSTALASCGISFNGEKGNYSGQGNDFILEGTVTEVGERSIELDSGHVAVTKDEGESADIVRAYIRRESPVQIHDNYKNRDCNRQTVGTVYERVAEEEYMQELDEIRPGDIVRVEGQTRDSATECSGIRNAVSVRPRLVFVRLIELEQPK
ncbi:MAG: hypothetical protein V4702_06175 [Patescibacteria group bacterium]